MADSLTNRALAPGRGGILALGLIVWAFAWDNAQTSPGIMDAHRTTILPIPHATRFLEVAAVALFFGIGLLHARKWSRAQQAGVTLVLCLLLLGVTSTVVSVLSGLVSIPIALQTVYTYFSPLLIASAVAMRQSSRVDLSRLQRVFVLLVGASIAMAWYQVVVRGAFADDVHGFMRNAHHFASAVWIVMLWCIARFLTGAGSRAWNLAGVFISAPVALAAANEKSNVALAIVLCMAGIWALWRWNLAGRLLVIGGAIAMVSTVRAVAVGTLILPDYFAHVQLVMEHLSQSGFVTGYGKIGHVVEEYPRIWILGTGPASYGSTKAIDQVVLGGEIPPLAARYTAESYRLSYAANGLIGSYVEQSTDLSAFLVEFGAVALVLLLIAVWCLVICPARRAIRHSDPEVAALGWWLIFSVGFVGVMSAVSAPYGWSALQTSVWPIMLVAGLVAGGALDGDVAAARTEIQRA